MQEALGLRNDERKVEQSKKEKHEMVEIEGESEIAKMAVATAKLYRKRTQSA